MKKVLNQKEAQPMQNNLPEFFVDGEKVEVKIMELWWQKRGLSFTASGYGPRIPTAYMVKFNGRWMRVCCCIFSNIGTLFIGQNIKSGHLVRDYA